MNVIERKPEVFESASFYDHRTVTSMRKRWIWAALDTVLPERKAELSYLQPGGEEVPSSCLKKYGPGFVPRGFAAMLELGGDAIPMRHLGELQAVAWQGFSADEHAKKNNFGLVPVYPGDGLKVLLRYMRNDGGLRKGVDEITALAGKEWEECHNGGAGILDVIERAQFGDGAAKTLKGLEDQIRHAVVNDSRVDYGSIRDEELKICESARNWGLRKVGIEHGLLKTGHVGEWQGGWSYAYSPVCELIIEQLELKRQDQPIQEMSEMVSAILANQKPISTGLSASDMELFERRLDERLAQAREADAKRIAELEAKLLNQQPEDKAYVCERCGKSFASQPGLAIHEARYCKTSE